MTSEQIAGVPLLAVTKPGKALHLVWTSLLVTGVGLFAAGVLLLATGPACGDLAKPGDLCQVGSSGSVTAVHYADETSAPYLLMPAGAIAAAVGAIGFSRRKLVPAA